MLQKDADGIEKRAKEYERFVNMGDGDGRTPLHYAAEMGLINIIGLLIKNLRADTEVRDRIWSTPLHRAILKGHIDAALLISKEPVQSLGFEGFFFSP